MIRSMTIAAFCVFVFSVGWAQSSTSSNAPAGAPAAANAPIIPIELSKTIDSKKLKQGDEVDAKTTADLRGADGTSIPRGSKVVGHVTQSAARSGGSSDSTLGISFEKIVLKDGKELPVKTVIQAVAAAPTLAGPTMGASGNSDMANRPPAASDGRGQAAPIGDNGTPSNLPATQANSGLGQAAPDAASGSRGAQTPLTVQSTGVIGLHGLEMGPNAVLTSSGKSVKLDSGTRMLLRVQSQ